MNINQFIAFVAIAKTGSFSKAATELFITQQGLSITIKNLESELGVTLLDRSNKGVGLTREGDLLLEKVQPLLSNYHDTLININSLFNIRNKAIVIGLANGVMQTLGQDIFYQLTNEFSNVKISNLEFPDITCEELLHEKSLDLAFSLIPYKHKDLEFIHIRDERLNAIMSKDNPLSGKKIISMAELCDQNFILLTEKAQFHNYTIQKCEDAGFTPKIRFNCSELITILNMVENGQGIFIGIDSIKVNDHVVMIPLDDDTFLWQAGLLYNKESLNISVISQMIQFTKDYFHLSK